VPLAAAGEREQSYIYADASGEQGWMAWAVEGGELLYAEGEWSELERRSLIICEKELLASTWGLVALQPLLQLAVVSYTDNTVAQAAMRSMAPGSAAMQELTARRTQFLFEHEVVEQSRRITSKANLWADLGSRRQLAAVLQQAERLGLSARRVAVPCAWRDTTELCDIALADHGGPPLPACRYTRRGAQARAERDPSGGKVALPERLVSRRRWRAALDRRAVVDAVPRLGLGRVAYPDAEYRH
jgi:hypothetical protein